MEEVKAHVINADAMLARISADGDALLMIAAIRGELKTVIDLLQKEGEQDGG